MNERIQKLAEQAEEWVCKNYPDAMDDNDEFHAQTMEKFAELLISKCLTICEELGDKGMDGHYCADEISRTFRS